MWDAGLGDGDPETHVGQLSNALLRDCRYLSAIGMHTGRMTQEQSRQMFRRANAIRTKAMPASRRRAAPTIPPISTTRWAS